MVLYTSSLIRRCPLTFAGYRGRAEAISQGLDDAWPAKISPVGSGDVSIVNADTDRVNLYLQTINMLWTLGIKKVVPQIGRLNCL
jgi:hypothetical protein